MKPLEQPNIPNDIAVQERMMNMSADPRHEDIIRYLVNGEKEIKERMMIFSGFKWDVMKGEWTDAERHPLLNDRGLSFVRGEFNHIINKFIIQSNLSEQQVQALIMSYASRIRRNLVANKDVFSIKCIADLDQIKNGIVDTAFYILRQPVDDLGRKFIFSPIKQVEQRTFQENSTQSRGRIGW